MLPVYFGVDRLAILIATAVLVGGVLQRPWLPSETFSLISAPKFIKPMQGAKKPKSCVAIFLPPITKKTHKMMHSPYAAITAINNHITKPQYGLLTSFSC